MATFKISVTGPDPDGRIARAAESGAALLSPHLASNAEITVSVREDDLPDGVIAAVPSVEVFQTESGLWESPAMWKLKGFADPNGDRPDIEIVVNRKLADSFTADEAVHEALHGIGFYGGGEGSPYPSPLDALTKGGKLTGSAVEAINGAPVPMVGNHFAIGDLMSPDGPASGHSLSPLTLAALNTLGILTNATFGTKADDALAADRGGSEIHGGYGSDTLSGKQGADTLDGGAGNDSIRGGKSGDVLSGAAGSDTLIGDLGDDTLEGGEGSDLFVFRSGDGCDVIDRFEVTDRIQLPGPYSVSIDQASMETRIAYEGGTVTLSLTTSWQDAWVAVA